MAGPISHLDVLSTIELKGLVERLLGEVVALRETVAAQREEIAPLKGLKGPPRLRPSGMESATTSASPSTPRDRRRRKGAKTAKLVVDEERVSRAAMPPGSRFKGYQSFVVQDQVLRPRVTRFRPEHWLTTDGRTVMAPLPPAIRGHFGPAPQRFVLMRYHQGQVSTKHRVTHDAEGHHRADLEGQRDRQGSGESRARQPGGANREDAEEGRLCLAGIGSFQVAKRGARKGRNPRTGEAIKASQTLKARA